MEIKNVGRSAIELENYRALKSQVTKPVENKQKIIEDSESLTSWQKDILVQALDELEKARENESNHPLSQARWIPIESFEEALIELNYIKSPFFQKDASLAQANIKPETIVALFLE